MKKEYAGFNRDKYLLLSKHGSAWNLSFSSHLVLADKIIALDGVKKCLLILEANNELNQPYIIELNTVRDVSVKKTYSSIAPGALRSKGIEEFIRRIDLRFVYTANEKPVILSFYNSEINKRRHIPMLEKNAKNWQLILSKLIMPDGDKTGKDNSRLSFVL